MTGPVLGTNSGQSVWGSAVGTLVSWEPVDFGLRRASVDAAKAMRDRTNAEGNVTKLRVAGTAAGAFLTIAADEQTVVAVKAGARATEQQATARYKAGLGNIAEVDEAERLLTQAEIDNSLVQLGVWRELLGVAAAQGDLAPFLTTAK
jgi:outer membrane protein